MIILVINPGSTSTKIAFYEFDQELASTSINHSEEELVKFESIPDQLDMRKEAILQWVQQTGYKFDIVVGRGGLLKPLKSGVYEINDKMVDELTNFPSGQHASNLGAIIAYSLANENGCKSYTVDPVVVDELNPISRVSGLAGVERKSIFHALNQKAMAREYCIKNNVTYTNVNLIVAHLGGGVSVGLHNKGRVIDVNNALEGEGPFSSERTGGLPLYQVLDLLEYKSVKEIKQLIAGKGGVVSYLGTNQMWKVVGNVPVDENAKLIVDAYCYQIAKEIAGLSVAVFGEIDGIILTGGAAHNAYITDQILDYVKHIGNVTVMPGEDELWALARQTVLSLDEGTVQEYGG